MEVDNSDETVVNFTNTFLP